MNTNKRRTESAFPFVSIRVRSWFISFYCSLCVLCAFAFSTSFAADKPAPVRGICLASLHRGEMSYGGEACRKQLQEIAALGANWVAITDFAWMRAVDDPHVRFRADRS